VRVSYYIGLHQNDRGGTGEDFSLIRFMVYFLTLCLAGSLAGRQFRIPCGCLTTKSKKEDIDFANRCLDNRSTPCVAVGPYSVVTNGY
jgi:hypothetical protein